MSCDLEGCTQETDHGTKPDLECIRSTIVINRIIKNSTNRLTLEYFTTGAFAPKLRPRKRLSVSLTV